MCKGMWLTQLNSSLLKHGWLKEIQQIKANKMMKVNELKTVKRTGKITTVQ